MKVASSGRETRPRDRPGTATLMSLIVFFLPL